MEGVLKLGCFLFCDLEVFKRLSRLSSQVEHTLAFTSRTHLHNLKHPTAKRDRIFAKIAPFSVLQILYNNYSNFSTMYLSGLEGLLPSLHTAFFLGKTFR